MGSHATFIGEVALASAFIGLLLGFLWGRSNVKTQIADALDKARASTDAREFDLMEQLSNKMLEINGLHARVEELPRLQEPPAQPKLEQVHSSVGNGASAEELGNTVRATQKLPWQKKEAARPIDSTDKTIQNLLKSMEEKLKQPEGELRVVTQQSTPPPSPTPTKLPAEEPRVVAQKVTAPPTPTTTLPAEEPRVVTQRSTPPPAPTTKLPAERPSAVTRQSPKPPTKSPTAGPPPAAKDEWQEFAASLEALTRRKK